MQPSFTASAPVEADTPDAYTHANTDPHTSSVDRCPGLSCGELPPVEGTAPLLEGRQRHVHVYICVLLARCASDTQLTSVLPFLKSLGLHWGQHGSPPAHVGFALHPSTQPDTQRKRTQGGTVVCVCVCIRCTHECVQ